MATSCGCGRELIWTGSWAGLETCRGGYGTGGPSGSYGLAPAIGCNIAPAIGCDIGVAIGRDMGVAIGCDMGVAIGCDIGPTLRCNTGYGTGFGLYIGTCEGCSAVWNGGPGALASSALSEVDVGGTLL